MLPLVGVASEHSHVVRGVVCRLRQDMIHIVHQREETTLRTMVGQDLLHLFQSGHLTNQTLSSVHRWCVEMP